MTSSPTTDLIVAHRSSVIAAGLVSILRRLPGCQVTTTPWDVPTDGLPGAGGTARIVFADLAFASRLLSQQAWQSPLRPGLVMITADPDTAAHPPGCLRPGLDSCLPVDCDEQLLFDTVRRLGSDPSLPPAPARRPRGGVAPAALRRVFELIDRRLAETLSMHDLAGVTGLSDSHFARAFKQSVGLPPHRYVMQRRIDIAADLVRDTDRLLTEIALHVGFSDQSHFTRTFASVKGETPSRFRRRHR